LRKRGSSLLLWWGKERLARKVKSSAAKGKKDSFQRRRNTLSVQRKRKKLGKSKPLMVLPGEPTT